MCIPYKSTIFKYNTRILWKVYENFIQNEKEKIK